MLFKAATLDAIRQGKVTLAFRRWRKPTVKPGGTLRTAIGVLAIRGLEPVEPEALTEHDAKRAGFANRAQLFADLAKQRDEPLYRISFEWRGADDRVALRARAKLKAEEIVILRDRLSRFDRTPDGPWSLDTLLLIDRHNNVAAGELADALGVDKVLFKRRVRKLKDLGLTESLQTGYRLAPRGRALLAALPNLR